MQAVKTVVTFIGVVFLLLGIYFTIRTVQNLQLKEYPLYVQSQGTELDCKVPQLYYQTNSQGQSTTRQSTAEEKENEKVRQGNCIKKIQDLRENAKRSDINEIILWLLLGVGILGSRKFIFR